MSGSMKPQDNLAAIGRILADNDRRLRTLETLAPPIGGGGLWVGDDEPTDGSVFWYDTDETC